MTWAARYRFGKCAWCETEVQFDVKYGEADEKSLIKTADGRRRNWTYMLCPRCGGPRVIEHDSEGLVSVVPQRTDTTYDVAHLPDDVQSYYDDAIRVLRVGVPDAAAVQLRRTLEAAASHFDAGDGPLFARVKKLIEMGLITTGFSDAVTHVRKLGNLGAHATDERLDHPTVERALRFTTQLLRNLFEVPAELESLKDPAAPVEADPEA